MKITTSETDFEPFPLSPRTQVIGISHLILSTHTKYVLVGGSLVIDDLWQKVNAVLEVQSCDIHVTRLPASDELFPYLNVRNKGPISIDRFPNLDPTTNKSLVAVLHSSGSTGLPRPVELTQESALTNLVHQRELSVHCMTLGDLYFIPFQLRDGNLQRSGNPSA